MSKLLAGATSLLLKLLAGATSFVSGEWMLSGDRQNGGGLVLARSLWSSLIIYMAALAALTRLGSDGAWTLSLGALRSAVAETIPWFGAIFAGTYTAFYARFASQWKYLAELYNHIKAGELQLRSQNPVPLDAERVLADWKAGFIEDAEELHLETKPIFASVVASWGALPEVRQSYIEATTDGERRFPVLLDRVKSAAQIHGRQPASQLLTPGGPETPIEESMSPRDPVIPPGDTR